MKEPHKICRFYGYNLRNEEGISSTITKRNKQAITKELYTSPFVKFMSSIISEIKNKISPLSPVIRNVWRLRLNVWIIKGEEKTTKQEIRIIYMGRDVSRHYIEDLVFSNIIEEKCIGKKWIWTTLKMARSNCTDFPLFIAETGDFLAQVFKEKQEYFIPCWIHGEINLHTNRKDYVQVKKGFKSDIRRIKRHELYYELTNGQVQFNQFYHDMYIPYAMIRFSKRATVENYYDLKLSFKKGELLLVKMGEIPIAGCLLKYIKKQAFLYALGIKDGNSYYVRLGAIAALYYYSIKYLIERGFSRINLGSTRPFLNDGVLKFKKKWGLKIVGTGGTGFLMKPLYETAVVKGFLLNNPFIFKDSNNVYGAVFLLPEQIDDQKSVEKLFHNYYIDGMSKLIIYIFDGVDSNIQMNIPSGFNDKIEILRAGETAD